MIACYFRWLGLASSCCLLALPLIAFAGAADQEPAKPPVATEKKAPVSERKKFTEEEAERMFAVKTNNLVWSLLEKTSRTAAEDELMIQAAHASYFHWLKAGTGAEFQRGAWLLSRVYTVVGQSAPALGYAKRCEELTKEHAKLMKDFDLAYSVEALARANALAGNREEAILQLRLATELGDKIAGAEDKKIFQGDLNGGNWFGIK